jgi:hypothetical protein
MVNITIFDNNDGDKFQFLIITMVNITILYNNDGEYYPF